MADRRYAPLKGALPGGTGLSVSDLADGDLLKWDSTTGKWTTVNESLYILVDGTRAFTDNILLSDATNPIIDLTTDSATLTLRGRTSLSANATLAELDPDGAAALYYAGSLAFESDVWGITAYDATATGSARLVLYDSASKNNLAQLRWIHGGSPPSLELKAEGTSATIRLAANDSGDVLRSLFIGDPDGAVNLYYDGTKVFETASSGVTVGTGSASAINMNRNGLCYINLTGGSLAALRVEDSSSNPVFQVDVDGATDIYDSGAKRFSTAANRIEVISNGSTNTTDAVFIALLGSDNARWGWLGHGASNGEFRIENEVHGNEVRIAAENAGGSFRTGFIFDPDTGVAFNGASSVAPPTYTVSTYSTDRALSASPSTTELRNVLASLIVDLQANGLLA